MTRRTEIKGSAKKRRLVKKSTPKTGRREEPEAEAEVRHDPGRPREIPTSQLRNVVADTIERMYEEMGGQLNRASAEDFAMWVVGFMKHGLWEGSTTDPLKLREVTMDVPLCSTCADAGD
jgi:hypothetical protein